MADAGAGHGIKARTGDYRVDRDVTVLKHKKIVTWRAVQDMMVSVPLVHGHVPASFGRMLAKIQSAGLQIEGMKGALSHRRRAVVRIEALRAALDQAEIRLHVMAVGLHEPVVGIKTVGTTISSPPFPIRPGGPMMMAAIAAPVQIAPARTRVSATVTITADLRFGTATSLFWAHFGAGPARP